MSTPDNPFVSPMTESPRETQEPDLKYATIGRVAVSWERLRFLFNGVLTVEVLLLSLVNVGRTWGDVRFYETLFTGVLIANAAFCLGPLIDGYASWLGMRHRAVTALLFFAGLAVGVGLAGLVVLAHAVELLPTPD